LVKGIDATSAPRSTQDRARWQAVGSPSVVQVDAGLGKGGTGLLQM
jgi:hypothetical protein